MRHGTYAEVATRQVENQLLQHLSTPLESKIEGHAEQQRILKESLSHWRRVSTGGNVASGQVYLKWSVNDKMVVDLPRSAVLDSHGRLKLQQYERYAGIQIKKYACTSNAVTPHAVDFHDIRWIANSALTEASFSTDSFVWLQCEGVSAKQDESLEGTCYTCALFPWLSVLWCSRVLNLLVSSMHSVFGYDLTMQLCPCNLLATSCSVCHARQSPAYIANTSLCTLCCSLPFDM